MSAVEVKIKRLPHGAGLPLPAYQSERRRRASIWSPRCRPTRRCRSRPAPGVDPDRRSPSRSRR